MEKISIKCSCGAITFFVCPVTVRPTCNTCRKDFFASGLASLGGEAGGESTGLLDSNFAPQEVGGSHYGQGLHITPWELQRTMKASGSVFVDARRADAIKYTWRMKGDAAKLMEDMHKAMHCLEAGIAELQKTCQRLKPAQQ